jgi:glyoxalase family protein
MEKLIRSLHHVTATVSDAQEDLDFYVKMLGMRLVKKTVNFDNHNVFHFYYGDEQGTPGTLMTTFPYKGWGVPVGSKGAGQIQVTSLSVPEGSLDSWRRRVTEYGVTIVNDDSRFGEETISFYDPSGLIIELVATGNDERKPWVADDMTEEQAVRGIHGVSMLVHSPEKTLELMTDILGFEVVNESESRYRLAVNGDVAGKIIEIVHAPDADPGVNGLGTVHHVAMAISDAEEQLRMRDELIGLGYHVTEVRDRQYFRSIYFREPGGVLFEIATVPPGFTVDEELPCLGQDLKLPPWEERHRAAIETGLPAVTHN